MSTTTPTTTWPGTRYELGVEELEPDHWVAWVFALPGCFAQGPTRAEALAAVPTRIVAYYAWLDARGDHLPGAPGAGEPPDIVIDEEFVPFVSEGDYLVNAFFADDRQPLTGEEIARGLALLKHTRRDLLAALPDVAEHERTRQVEPILMHVAIAEWWYLDRLGLACPREALPADTLARLEFVRAWTQRRLPELVGDTRVVTRRGEQWSARKVLRRALGHERDHTEQIAALTGK